MSQAANSIGSALEDHSDAAAFFSAISLPHGPRRTFDVVSISHLTPDRPPYFAAINAVSAAHTIVPIPYSVDPQVDAWAASAGIPRCVVDDLLDPPALLRRLLQILDGSRNPVVISEIGGYVAPIANELAEALGDRLLGVVEDTESGHRRYAELPKLDVPVLSAARSPLKEPEDEMIGHSVMFSIERILRRTGRTLNGIDVTVLGAGRIGLACARSARARGGSVAIFDMLGVRRARALAMGFRVPERMAALDADLVVGASGQRVIEPHELNLLRNGAFLASASSKSVEFPAAEMALQQTTVPHLAAHDRGDGSAIFLIADGHPVNFLDGGVVGPFLRLVQGEIIGGILELATTRCRPGLQELDPQRREKISEVWLETFIDRGGNFRHRELLGEPE